MKRFIFFVVFIYTVFSLLLFGVIFTAKAADADWPTYYPLMVDQFGNIRPEGYAAGLAEIAQAEAQAETTRQATELLAQTTASASNVVNDVVAALTGAYGFAYVTGYTVSFDGAVQVSTNAVAHMVYLELGAGGSTNITGTAYTGHYVWHVYSEQMPSTPLIKYKRTLNGTNAWEFVEYQSTAQYTDTTVNGTFYSTVYRSTVWLPSTYSSAFFMAFCEIIGGGSAGGLLEIIDGFSVNGQVGFTGTVIDNGCRMTYDRGLLMSVTNEVAQ